MIRVVVVGVCGRMGSEIVRLIQEQSDMKIVAGVEAPGHPLVGTPVGSGLVVSELNQVVGEGDVVVDFSVPDVVLDSVRVCVRVGKPLVTGVTGFREGEIEILKDAGKKVPILYAANFSTGIAVLKRLVKETARLVGKNWDVHIVEAHHTKKKDAPSGTAKMLVAAIKEQIEDKSVAVSSIRAGDIVGVHRILFAGPGEHIELIHQAESRVAFVWGVIAGVRWIIGKKPGFYSIDEVIGLS